MLRMSRKVPADDAKHHEAGTKKHPSVLGVAPIISPRQRQQGYDDGAAKPTNPIQAA